MNEQIKRLLEQKNFQVDSLSYHTSITGCYTSFDIKATLYPVPKEPINELEDMNEITQITTQESAFNVIKLQGYIIGSIDAQGNVSVSNSPKVHWGPHSARTECARLAKINPGKAFFFTKMIGAEMVPNTFISI